MEETKKCKACSHKEIGSLDEVSASIDNYLAVMDEDICIDMDTYNKRLEACFSCDSLYGGATCKFCGCFVRIRAKLKEQTCPYPSQNRWSLL